MFHLGRRKGSRSGSVQDHENLGHNQGTDHCGVLRLLFAEKEKKLKPNKQSPTLSPYPRLCFSRHYIIYLQLTFLNIFGLLTKMMILMNCRLL